MIDVKLIQQAILLAKQRKFDEAKELYSKLLKENPEDYMLLSAIGLFYVSLNDYKNAKIYLEKACKIKETFGTISALGFAEYEQGNYEQAIKILLHSLDFGKNADVYNKLVLSCFKLGDYENAIKYSGIMYENYPENENSVTNMVKSLTQSGQLMEAEKLCVEFLKEHNDAASLWIHLGFLKELIYSDDKQSIECFKIAQSLGYNEALYNIAVSYTKLNDFINAELYYKKMLEAFPNDIETITSLGMCYLKQKKFKKGYDLFYNRPNTFVKNTNNLWNQNDKLDKNEIVVICDQGYGDHIQFIRYLPELQKMVEKIYVASRPSLTPLFKKNYPDIEFITIDEINPEIQAIRITDLAYVLNIDFDNIPFSNGYLKSEKAEINSDKLKVGLCWEAGSAGIRTMINRTINIRLLEPILNIERAQIYSFQVTDSLNGNERYPQMINLAKDFKNFEEKGDLFKELVLKK